MTENRTTISIHISNGSEKFIVKTYRHAYRNLMALLTNNLYLENFGECGGQGRCATCLVKISGYDMLKNSITRNEQTTLNKMQLSDISIRLACQILITESLDGCLIEIVEDNY